jgi:hypothetical protein
VLGCRQLDARLTVGPALETRGRTRRELAATTRAFVASVLADARAQDRPPRPPLRLPRAA